MLMFTLAISCLTTSNLPWFMDLTFQVPMHCCSYSIRFYLYITSHIHNWVLFLLWLCLFILSVVISPLLSSSILGTYRPGEFIFQCPIFLPFHTVQGVLKARILKWFPFSVDHILSELSTMTCLGWPYMAWFIVSLSLYIFKSLSHDKILLSLLHLYRQTINVDHINILTKTLWKIKTLYKLKYS